MLRHPFAPTSIGQKREASGEGLPGPSRLLTHASVAEQVMTGASADSSSHAAIGFVGASGERLLDSRAQGSRPRWRPPARARRAARRPRSCARGSPWRSRTARPPRPRATSRPPCRRQWRRHLDSGAGGGCQLQAHAPHRLAWRGIGTTSTDNVMYLLARHVRRHSRVGSPRRAPDGGQARRRDAASVASRRRAPVCQISSPLRSDIEKTQKLLRRPGPEVFFEDIRFAALQHLVDIMPMAQFASAVTAILCRSDVYPQYSA